MTDDLISLKREFTANQMPDLEERLLQFIIDHPVFGELPERDQRNAAYSAATHLLLAIRSQSVVGLVR